MGYYLSSLRDLKIAESVTHPPAQTSKHKTNVLNTRITAQTEVCGSYNRETCETRYWGKLPSRFASRLPRHRVVVGILSKLVYVQHS